MATPTGSGIGGRRGSGVNSAVRGAGLVGLAVILGIVLLQVIDKGPAGSGSTPAGTSRDNDDTDTDVGGRAGNLPAGDHRQGRERQASR